MDEFVGAIVVFAFGFAPRGWWPCDGRILEVSQNTALYSLLGNTYGGELDKTFAIPKLEPIKDDLGRTVGNYFIAYQGIFPPRQQ